MKEPQVFYSSTSMSGGGKPLHKQEVKKVEGIGGQ